MTTSFSSAKITLGSCMPCLRPVSSSDSLHNTTNQRPNSTSGGEEQYNATVNRIPRARPDELQGLLADSSDNERAETLSLHLNPGRGSRGGRRKRKSKSSNTNGKPRRITLFGFDLFGRPPPIQLPPDDDDAPLFHRHRSSSGGGSTPTTTLTTQTFDSDAAPLDISTIQQISVSKASEAAKAELKRKEERRQRRKARKEMNRLVEAGVVGGGEEFEGFQGSVVLVGGRRRLRLRRALIPGLTLDPSNQEKVLGTSYPPLLQQQQRRKTMNTQISTEACTSDSRRNRSSLSRTSASASDRAQPNPAVPNPNRPKSKSKRSSTSQSRSRSNTSSQSPSLQSPSSPAFSDAQIISPSTVEQGQGFFDLENDLNEMPVGRIGGDAGRIGGGGGGFLMTGFGGGGGKRSSDFGAFLARRGDEKVGEGGGDGVPTYTPPLPDSATPPASYMLIH
ncbi:uncharacterized protein LACBIDRAFT_333478 [Laccaria bicolor S238N-H82]|uniref:Predicted protein n=1 Tax=Laccaria bicolor (strain S238N-H82 / ATCC MYA-4686) TaxID=486041 RepID=B0DW19_LACBS|nr:uncharacterized protein LACBIDRAFT_333478 [Laccaria bicolor S238N-H82]EDR01269.1 predicted protein [Laccaria bicolor S238N-H82]|eukprot:XP_001888145.1 predicted protein [Laccaria bicolor S238N-H82]